VMQTPLQGCHCLQMVLAEAQRLHGAETPQGTRARLYSALSGLYRDSARWAAAGAPDQTQKSSAR
jgi:hypothetical protein